VPFCRLWYPPQDGFTASKLNTTSTDHRCLVDLLGAITIAVGAAVRGFGIHRSETRCEPMRGMARLAWKSSNGSLRQGAANMKFLERERYAVSEKGIHPH
jgi:hypothetical protein